MRGALILVFIIRKRIDIRLLEIYFEIIYWSVCSLFSELVLENANLLNDLIGLNCYILTDSYEYFMTCLGRT